MIVTLFLSIREYLCAFSLRVYSENTIFCFFLFTVKKVWESLTNLHQKFGSC